MKTALEQLIDKIIEFGQKCASEGDSDGAMMCAEIHVEAEDLLPTEKQQIIDAYDHGQMIMVNSLFEELKSRNIQTPVIDSNDKTDADNYYTETFKDK